MIAYTLTICMPPLFPEHLLGLCASEAHLELLAAHYCTALVLYMCTIYVCMLTFSLKVSRAHLAGCTHSTKLEIDAPTSNPALQEHHQNAA